FLSRSRVPRDLHSFPTRRSSDLVTEDAVREIDELGRKLVPFLERFAFAFAGDRKPMRELVGVIVRGFDEQVALRAGDSIARDIGDRKSTRLNSSHLGISYAVFCL